MRRNRIRKGEGDGCAIVALVFGLALGVTLGSAIVNGEWSDSAAKGGNAHYDPKTGKYQWDGWANDLAKKPQGVPSSSEKE